MTDITPEAVEHLCAIHEGYEQHGTVATLRALSAALTASQAETAAAYEDVVRYLQLTGIAGDHRTDPLSAQIRALTPADSKAALDRMIADAEARGMRKAAGIVDNDVHKLQPEMTKRAQRLKDAKSPGFQYAIHRADLDARMSCRDKILAAIQKGKDHE